jgi:hypothetical protein
LQDNFCIWLGLASASGIQLPPQERRHICGTPIPQEFPMSHHDHHADAHAEPHRDPDPADSKADAVAAFLAIAIAVTGILYFISQQ